MLRVAGEVVEQARSRAGPILEAQRGQAVDLIHLSVEQPVARAHEVLGEVVERSVEVRLRHRALEHVREARAGGRAVEPLARVSDGE